MLYCYEYIHEYVYTCDSCTDLGSRVFIPNDPSSISSACVKAVHACSGVNSWGA